MCPPRRVATSDADANIATTLPNRVVGEVRFSIADKDGTGGSGDMIITSSRLRGASIPLDGATCRSCVFGMARVPADEPLQQLDKQNGL